MYGFLNSSILDAVKVLIANTSPYPAPVSLFNAFHNEKMEELTSFIFNHRFQFSVISPRLILPLKKMFSQASGQPGKTKIENSE